MTDMSLIAIGIGVTFIFISLLFVAFGSWSKDSTLIIVTAIIGLLFVVVGRIIHDGEK